MSNYAIDKELRRSIIRKTFEELRKQEKSPTKISKASIVQEIIKFMEDTLKNENQ